MITTVLPTYRRPDSIQRAIRSVQAQTYPNWRLCVYDNSQGHETSGVVRRLAEEDSRIEYYQHPSNIGVVRNFEFGLERVQTPYFSFLSDDDLLLPSFFEVALGALQSDPKLGFAVTDVIHIDQDGIVLRSNGKHLSPGSYEPPDGMVMVLDPGLPMWHGMLFRRQVLETVGRLSVDAGNAADLDYVLRAASHFRFRVEPDAGAVFSHSEDSVSGDIQLDSTWPGWLSIMEHVAADKSVPTGLRDRVHSMLTERLISRLYDAGLAASRRGDFAVARQVRTLLRDRYHQARKAAAIGAVGVVCRYIPGAVPALRAGRRGWLTLRGHSRRRTSMRLADLPGGAGGQAVLRMDK